MDRNPDLTRRHFLGAAAGSCLLLGSAATAFGASEFWNKKPAADWSSDEVQQLITKSPWAKPVRAGFGNASRGRFGTGGGGNGDPNGYPGNNTGGYPGGNTGNYPGGGYPGGSRGGYPGGYPGGNPGGYPGGYPQTGGGVGMPGRGVGMPGGGGGGQRGQRGESPREDVALTVRWESAKPVREAVKDPLPAAFADRYVIGVSGLPSASAPDSDSKSEKDDDVLDRLKASAFLQAKGKEPIQPGLVQRSKDGSEVLFGFAKEFLTLSASDKDVQFSLVTGQISVKARFDPREMMYRGQFEA